MEIVESKEAVAKMGWFVIVGFCGTFGENFRDRIVLVC